MQIAFWPAMIAGFIGGVLMVVMQSIMRKAGLELPMDISRVWGSMLKLHGTLGWLVGSD